MANIQRTYTGGATATALTVAMSAGSPGSGGTFAVGAAAGWPNGAPFTAVIDRGKPEEETVLCASRSDVLFVVAPGGRGFDGTVAKAHDAGAVVEHCFDSGVGQGVRRPPQRHGARRHPPVPAAP